MTKLIKVECHKCGGSGKVSGFSHIANGDCFACGAVGHRMVSEAKLKSELPELADYVKAKAEFILNATEEQIDSMTFKQISASRDFAHSYLPHYGRTVLEAWFEKFNERFCYLQDEHIERSRHEWQLG